MDDKHYWGYRISNENASFFMRELHNGRLRQGWGYDEGQNLRNMTVDEGAGRNRRMLSVRKGDILLIPNLPEWDEVALVEATQDWEEGYRFDIPVEMGDFGHIFPARYLRSFKRGNEFVSGDIRSTLHNVGRFWNIDHLATDIEALLQRPQNELSLTQDLSDRFKSTVGAVYAEMINEDTVSRKLFERLNGQFNASEWEYALVEGLRVLYPEPYFSVERVGGIMEAQHGADIIIRIPSLFESYEYVIAIQVKDYEGFVSDHVLFQIRKADTFFNNDNQRLIEKIVIVTRAEKTLNEPLADCGDVRFIFAEDLRTLLYKISRLMIGNTLTNQ